MTARPPTVADLVGQRLATIGRAADMAWLGFGEKRVDDRGRVVHAYALHLQTAFRLLEGDHVLLP
jgi:hypothetical protein